MTNAYQFSGSLSGRRVVSGVLAYAVLFFLLAAGTLRAQTYSVLHTFTGQTDGGWPMAEVIGDTDGNLYGTATIGGSPSDCKNFSGCGTIFKLDPNGDETVLYNFTGGKDGFLTGSFGNLIRDRAGNFYGTAASGGSGDNGTAFRLSPSGKLTVLYSFCTNVGCTDGAAPQGGLLRDADGTLYGTTFSGGAKFWFGTVFKITKAGKYTVLHSFTGYDGSGPVAGLVADAAGNLYGTASSGGKTGDGTVFKITKSGKFTVLYTFKGAPDGQQPSSRLALDKAGNIYGSTWEGGDAHVCPGFGCGVIFEVSKKGKERILHTFLDKDGLFPNEVYRDAQGDIFGTTEAGGTYNNGNIYKLDDSGNFTDLYDFTGGTDGGYQFAGLIQDSAGNLYGTNYQGGLAGGCPYGGGCGTVFKLVP